jgi:MarR family transcriptional regulator for hemolysin
VSRIRDVWVFANNIIRTARQLVNEELKPLGLTSAEGNILLHLLTQAQVLRQEDIVEQLDISKPAVSRALESLESKRFITREKDQQDKRVSRVYLTEQARELGPEVEHIYNRVFTIAAKGLTKQEIEGAVTFFGRVSANFSSARQLRKGGKDDVAE